MLLLVGLASLPATAAAHAVESAYLAHAFAGTREVVVGKQTRDQPQQRLTADYTVAPGAAVESRTRSGAVFATTGALALLGSVLVWSRRRKHAGEHLVSVGEDP